MASYKIFYAGSAHMILKLDRYVFETYYTDEIRMDQPKD
jgi:hypothetical protein